MELVFIRRLLSEKRKKQADKEVASNDRAESTTAEQRTNTSNHSDEVTPPEKGSPTGAILS